MRPLLVVLCLVVGACAAGLEYGGLTTLTPSSAQSPAPCYALSAPGTELYFAWTVAEPDGSEWYSFSFTVDFDTTGLCIEVAPAGQLSIGADCKSCKSVGQQVFMPQTGQWLARITNCLAPSPASSGVKILPIVLTAVICPPGMYGPLCESTITQLAFNLTAEIAIKPTDALRYFSYSFDQSAGPVSYVSFYHNLTYNPVNPGAPGYSIVEMAPSVLAPQVLRLSNDYEGEDYLDIDPSWAPPDYNVASPLGRNVIAVVPSSPAGTYPATHALTLMAEAIVCTPPYFGEHQKITCPYFFSGAVAVDPTQVVQTLSVSGSFNVNDIHSHSGGSTHLYKFYNITLPMTANLLSVTRTGGDATVSLAYHTIGSAYSQTRAQFVAQPGVWVLGVTSQTNSSFELVVTVEACPDACSKQGICEIATSSCYCTVGFQGPVCQSVELITESVTVTVPPSSWAFYEVLVSHPRDTIEIGVNLTRDPAQRVVAFVSYGPFAVTTIDALHVPFVFLNNTFSYPHPTIGSWNVAIYNSAGRSEAYVITSNIFAPVGPTNPPNPNRNGVNVVTIIVILFVGVFFVTLSIAAWIQWAAARGGYVSIQ